MPTFPHRTRVIAPTVVVLTVGTLLFSDLAAASIPHVGPGILSACFETASPAPGVTIIADRSAYVALPDGNCPCCCGNDPVNNSDPMGLWWWDGDLIEDGLGGMVGVYGTKNAGRCWSGSGRRAAEGAAIYYNELTFGLLDRTGATFTGEYQGKEYDAARAIGRVTRSVEIGLAAGGGLSSASAAIASQGGSAALYGTAALRAGVAGYAANSARQNANSAVVAFEAGQVGESIAYTTLATLDALSMG